MTTQGYCHFRRRPRGKQFNERSDGVLNRISLPSDSMALLVFYPLRYRLTLFLRNASVAFNILRTA